MLSEHERKQLHEIERELRYGDPVLSGKFTALGASEPDRRRQLVVTAWGALLAAGAVTCYLTGLVIGAAVVGVLAVVVPALLMANGAHR